MSAQYLGLLLRKSKKTLTVPITSK